MARPALLPREAATGWKVHDCEGWGCCSHGFGMLLRMWISAWAEPAAGFPVWEGCAAGSAHAEMEGEACSSPSCLHKC